MMQRVKVYDGTGNRIHILLDVDIKFDRNTMEYHVKIPPQEYRETTEFAQIHPLIF